MTSSSFSGWWSVVGHNLFNRDRELTHYLYGKSLIFWVNASMWVSVYVLYLYWLYLVDCICICICMWVSVSVLPSDGLWLIVSVSVSVYVHVHVHVYVYVYGHLARAFALPQIQQCCHDCSCPIGSRWQLLSLFSSFICCHMLIGLCPNLLCFLTLITFKPHYDDASTAAMYAMKTSASQEQAVQASTGPSPASSTTVLFPDVMEPRRDTSPTKQPRTDRGWEELLTSLAARYIDLTGLDYALQQALRSSPHT